MRLVCLVGLYGCVVRVFVFRESTGFPTTERPVDGRDGEIRQRSYVCYV